MITAERLKETLNYCPHTGVFTRKNSYRRWKAGQVAGMAHKIRGYIYIGIDKSNYLAHRLAWLYVYGTWPDKDIDHIDGNITNNRIQNLRLTTETHNSQNQRQAHKGSYSGLLGVYPAGKRWRAMITVNKKTISLGVFATKDEAYDVYIKNKRKLHPGCTI